MFFDKKTKNIFKIATLVFAVVVLTGCTPNIDTETGKLIAERAINSSTPWTMSAGWFDFLFVIPISKLILFASDVVGNVAFGVIFATILINIITLPVMIKSTVASQKIQLIQPEITKIQNKYKGRKDQASQMRMSNEMNALYKKNDVSMLGSLSTFLTLPIMIAMWQAVQRIEILYTTNFMGFNLGDKPMDHVMKFAIPYIILIALVGVTQFFAMEMTNIMARRNPHYKMSNQMKQMQNMNKFMILMIVWCAISMPTAMSLYWITTNVITMVRTVYIQIYHVEKSKQEVKEANTNYLNK